MTPTDAVVTVGITATVLAMAGFALGVMSSGWKARYYRKRYDAARAGAVELIREMERHGFSEADARAIFAKGVDKGC